MDASTDRLISELTDAFNRLKIIDSERLYLGSYIRFLAEKLGPVSHEPYPNKFTNKTAVVVPEIQELSSRATELLDYLSTIHQSTILTLADVSARNTLIAACAQMVKTAEATLKTLNLSDDDTNSNPPSNSGGRPRKDRALQLAVSLAGNYQRLTGNPPVIQVDFESEGNPAVGDFHRLLDDVFGILKIDANPENFGKKAIKAHTVKTSPQ